MACIPSYNEASTIGGVVSEALEYVDEVVVCDDGSDDNTGEVAETCGAFVLSHGVNLGKGVALRSCFREALKHEPDVVVMLDSDGQHDPGDIPRVVEPVLSGEADVVIGSRYITGGKTNPPLYRRVGLWIIKTIYGWSGGADITDTQSGFRAFNKYALVEVLNSKESGYNVETEQLFRLTSNGYRITEVPITVNYDVPKPSKKNPTDHGYGVFQYIFNFIIYEKPLQIIGTTGLIFSIAGILTTIFLLQIFNETRYFSIPWALISFGLLLIGLLLVMNSVLLYSIKGLKRYLD